MPGGEVLTNLYANVINKSQISKTSFRLTELENITQNYLNNYGRRWQE